MNTTSFTKFCLQVFSFVILLCLPIISVNAFDASALKKKEAGTQEKVKVASNSKDTKTPTVSENIILGKKLFGNTCLFCHGAKGKGARAPSLISGHWAPGGANDDDYMRNVILNGRKNTIMGGFKNDYTSDEVKSIMVYLRHEAKLLAEKKSNNNK